MAVNENAVVEMAAALHEEWRKTRLKADGTYEPSFKKSKDEAWTAAHGTDDVDIANTCYADLPSNWQADNYAAAKAAVEAVARFGVTEEAGSLIHEDWMELNAWAKDDPELSKLFISFSSLSEAEKEKDMAQVRTAARFLGI